MKSIAALIAATASTSLAPAQDFPASERPAPTPAASQPAPNPARNPDAARSVHLWWTAPAATAFVNEMTVDESVAGSYFMACGFSGGYFGLQQLADNKRVAIFSVWDEPGTPTTDNPNAVAAAQRVEVLAPGDGVEVSRFGGEGTGAKTIWPFSWKTGRTYKFLVLARPDQNRVIYSAYLAGPGLQGWKLMASLRARAASRNLSGLYSFVEDFRRDGKSLGQKRRARFSNGWVRTSSNAWQAITLARFGADANTHTNINGAIETKDDSQFFVLETGGITRPSGTVGSTLTIAPLQLPS